MTSVNQKTKKSMDWHSVVERKILLTRRRMRSQRVYCGQRPSASILTSTNDSIFDSWTLHGLDSQLRSSLYTSRSEPMTFCIEKVPIYTLSETPVILKRKSFGNTFTVDEDQTCTGSCQIVVAQETPSLINSFLNAIRIFVTICSQST